MIDNKFIVKDVIKFSIPVLFGLIGTILISTGDTIVAARYSTVSAAALSVAGGFHGIIFLFGIGLSQGLAPKLSYRLGRGEQIESLIPTLIVYGLMIGIISMIFFWLVIPWLIYFGYDPKLVDELKDYLIYFAFSNPFAFIFITVKEYYQVHNKVLYPNLISVIAVGVNILLNILLAFGWGMIPSMGLKGIAISSIVVRVWIALMLILPLIKNKILKNLIVDFKFLKETFIFSIPIALAQLFESSAFSIVAIFVGKIGLAESAANGIAFNIIALTFMVPLTISIAMTVRVGRFYGANNILMIKNYIKVGIIMTLLVMIIYAVLMIGMPKYFVSLYTKDLDVINIGISILFVTAIFQLFDGIQCLGAFILRGLSISRPVMVISFIAFWVVAIPLGLILAQTYQLGVVGHWWGLVAGLFIAASGYMIILRNRLKGFQN